MKDEQGFKPIVNRYGRVTIITPPDASHLPGAAYEALVMSQVLARTEPNGDHDMVAILSDGYSVKNLETGEEFDVPDGSHEGLARHLDIRHPGHDPFVVETH